MHVPRLSKFTPMRPQCRERKLLALIQKQDRLLYLCFYMLLNLAEDSGVERKMKKKVRPMQPM